MANLSELSLDQVELKYRQGLVSADELRSYLIAWNNTPGRFTFAYWSDGAIRKATYRDNGTLPWIPVSVDNPIH